MKPLRLVGLVVVASAFAAFGQSLVTGNAQRGATLFKTQNCIKCHSVKGEGGRIAPDLGRIVGRNYSPVTMASLMWNHAPTMWATMETQGITKPKLTEQEAADLFAYFYAARYFDKPGDAARGKRVFEAKHCAECHGLTSPLPGGPNPVVQWQSLADPILLAEQMWNHGADMRAAFEKKKIKWPELTSQNLTDLLVYLQNLPQTKGPRGPTAGAGRRKRAEPVSGQRLLRLPHRQTEPREPLSRPDPDGFRVCDVEPRAEDEAAATGARRRGDAGDCRLSVDAALVQHQRESGARQEGLHRRRSV